MLHIITNWVADTFSRIKINTLLIGVDYKAFVTSQQWDTEIQRPRSLKTTSLKLQDVIVGETTLPCDTSMDQARPLVPLSLKRQAFYVVHGLALPGVKTTQRLVSKKFLWHGLSKQVGTLTKECTACQQSKIPSHRFEHMIVNIVGPLASSQGYTHLLTIADRFTG